MAHCSPHVEAQVLLLFLRHHRPSSLPLISAAMTNESQNKPRDASGLLVQIASYNTNLQGVLGLPQDLVDWLAPTLQVSNFLSGGARAPDIVAVGFQELLPLHLGRTLLPHLF